MRLWASDELQEEVARTGDRHLARIKALMPDAVVEHIGSTAVPGAVTKGDLDLLVRVQSSVFERARHLLAETYAVHQPENWTSTFASYVDPQAERIPTGIQLVVEGSHDDWLFLEWRNRLRRDPDLLQRWNRLKQSHREAAPDAYVEAKAGFIEAELSD